MQCHSAPGRSQDFALGATEAEHQRRENRNADGAQGSRDWGGGVPLPNRRDGLGERRELPHRGRGVASAANAILAYLRPTEHFW